MLLRKIHGNIFFWVPQELRLFKLLLLLCVCQRQALFLEMVEHLFYRIVCEVEHFVLNFLEPRSIIGFDDLTFDTSLIPR